MERETQRCPHCRNPFIVRSGDGAFKRHVKSCKGKTPSGPMKRKDHPSKRKDKRGHK